MMDIALRDACRSEKIFLKQHNKEKICLFVGVVTDNVMIDYGI